MAEPEQAAGNRDDVAIKLKVTRLFVTLSLGCTAVVALYIALSKSLLALMALLAAMAAAVVAWWLAGVFSRRGWGIQWLLALAVVNLLIVIPELILRHRDYHYESGIQFGYPSPAAFIHFDADEKLFWRLKTTEPGVNSWGFHGPEPRIEKPEGTYRMMFLGDSCTQQGYPDMVETFMNAAHPTGGIRFESLVFAVAGYTSHQGRVVAEMFGEEFSPDVAFVYFGWNDHWHAYGAIDADKVVRVPATKGGAARILDHLYQRLRVLQRVNSVLQRTHDAAPPLSVPRVPPEHYRANLRRIKEVFDRRQTPVVFITAPTSMYQTGVPGNLVGLRFASSKEEVLTSHREYNAIVREVAAQTGAHLLDLEAELAVLRNPRSVFTEDGIHFTPDGYAVVAKRVADIIDTNVRKPEAKTDTPKPDAPKADAPDGGQAPK